MKYQLDTPCAEQRSKHPTYCYIELSIEKKKELEKTPLRKTCGKRKNYQIKREEEKVDKTVEHSKAWRVTFVQRLTLTFHHNMGSFFKIFYIYIFFSTSWEGLYGLKC